MKIKNKQKYLKNKKASVKQDPFVQDVPLEKILWCNDCKNWYEKNYSCYCYLHEIDERTKDVFKKGVLNEKN